MQWAGNAYKVQLAVSDMDGAYPLLQQAAVDGPGALSVFSRGLPSN